MVDPIIPVDPFGDDPFEDLAQAINMLGHSGEMSVVAIRDMLTGY
jgi:hypothetical protein